MLTALRVLPDDALLERGRDGDWRAYDVLCARHSYLATRFARQLGLGAEARQVLTDVFAQALLTDCEAAAFRDVILRLIRAEFDLLNARAALHPAGSGSLNETAKRRST